MTFRPTAFSRWLNVMMAPIVLILIRYAWWPSGAGVMDGWARASSTLLLGVALFNASMVGLRVVVGPDGISRRWLLTRTVTWDEVDRVQQIGGWMRVVKQHGRGLVLEGGGNLRSDNGFALTAPVLRDAMAARGFPAPASA